MTTTTLDADAYSPVYAARTRAVLLAARDGIAEGLILQAFGISRRTYFRWLADARAAEAGPARLRVVGP